MFLYYSQPAANLQPGDVSPQSLSTCLGRKEDWSMITSYVPSAQCLHTCSETSYVTKLPPATSLNQLEWLLVIQLSQLLLVLLYWLRRDWGRLSRVSTTPKLTNSISKCWPRNHVCQAFQPVINQLKGINSNPININIRNMLITLTWSDE